MDWSVCKGNDCGLSNLNGIPKTRATKRVRVAEIKPKTQESGVPDFGMGCFPSFPFLLKGEIDAN